MKTKALAIFCLTIFIVLISMQFILAVDFNQGNSNEDKATFDEILEPVMKIYNLIKYSATVIAILVLLFAGINYMTSGADPKKREMAKNMVMYVIIGLLVIWAAPLTYCS